jgi:hypothetical protein
MAAICRIYEKTEHGVRLIAQIRGSRVTGWKAGAVRKMLKRYGFPHAPIEAVIDQLLLEHHTLGAAVIPDKEQD